MEGNRCMSARKQPRNTLPDLSALPVLPEEPPMVRKHLGGLTGTMETAWRDPDDTVPNASRRPREVRGWRTYCPLRRLRARHGSEVTVEHVMAADHLRENWDIARCGFSNPRDILSPVNGLVPPQPKLGPTVTAVKQVTAANVVNRAMAAFPVARDRRMIHTVILCNATVSNWCRQEGARARRLLESHREIGRLIGVLDVLAEHFASEVAVKLRYGVEAL
jgi:hypothetical protein